jgi:AcrR family transcriptional regulator
MVTVTRDDQRRRVLDVASRLFAQYGTENVTMAEIGEAADVARATVFNYFGTKHALVEAITETVLDTYREMLDAAIADEATSTPQLLRQLCDDMAVGIESQRRLFRSVFREIARIQLGLDDGEVAQRANRLARSRLLMLIERGQARGELNNKLAAESLADAFHALVNGTITTWLYQTPSGALRERMQAAVEVFLAPVAAKGATR